MLVLSRKSGEEIVIDGNIRVKVVSAKNGRVRLAIDAPPDVAVNRLEVIERDQNSENIPELALAALIP